MNNNSQSRTFLLTINNPINAGFTHQCIKEKLLLSNPTYFCMSDEIGESGTYHTHVYARFSSPVRFGTLKKRFPTAHIDSTYGSALENRTYILKGGKWEDSEKSTTCVEGTFEESGTIPSPAEERSPDMAVLINLIKSGLTNTEIIEKYPKYAFRLKDINQIRETFLSDKYLKTLRTDLSVTYIYGASGVGKTKSIFDTHDFKDICRITDYTGSNGVKFDAYHAQKSLVFEEFHSQIPIAQMLNYLDIYPVTLPARYYDRVACYNEVFITSNISLDQQYSDIQKSKLETWHAFLRRIQNVVEYKSDGQIIYHRKNGKEVNSDE